MIFVPNCAAPKNSQISSPICFLGRRNFIYILINILANKFRLGSDCQTSDNRFYNSWADSMRQTQETRASLPLPAWWHAFEIKEKH